MAKLRRSIGYLRGRGDNRSRITAFDQKSLQVFAASRAWPQPEIIVSEVGTPLIVPNEKGMGSGFEPSHIARTFGHEALVVVAGFRDLADTPRALREGLPELLAIVPNLHIASLGGSVAQHLPVLLEAWSHAEPIEEALDAEKARYAEASANYQQMFSRFQKDLTASFVKLYGVPAAGLPAMRLPDEVRAALANGHDTTAQVPALNGHDMTPVGAWLKQMREERGIKQDELATALGVSSATISRAESTGEGPQVVRILDQLQPDWIEPSLREYVDAPLILLHLAKAHLNGNAETVEEIAVAV